MSLLIPTTPAAITAEWLTAALRKTTIARVTTAHLARIGKDQSFSGGTLYRLSLTYAGTDPTAPATLIAKLAPAAADMRATMAAANHREAAFYQTQAPFNNPHIPHCYHADFDAKTGASILLLQDLTAHRSVPFANGCGAADAKFVVAALAALHAQWWNAPDLAAQYGAPLLQGHSFANLWAQYPEKLHAILQPDDIPKTFLALGHHIAQHAAAIFANQAAAPITRLHRDCQLDNVMFGGAGAVLLDWQMSGAGRGADDLGYFLISSVDPATRRQIEGDLLAQYHADLAARGVADYPLSQCWADYLKSVAGKLLLTVAATVLFDNSSPHKQAWRRADLTRLLAFCADHSISAQTFDP